MRYDISIIEKIPCVTIEGNLNSLDLMFMFQSPEYKNMLNQYERIFIDCTNICGSTLMEEDVFAISMLGKMNLDNLGKKTIVMAVNENEYDVIEKVTRSIFSGHQTELLYADSKSNALKILHST